MRIYLISLLFPVFVYGSSQEKIEIISGGIEVFNSENEPLFSDGDYFELSCTNNSCTLKNIFLQSKKALVEVYDSGLKQGYKAKIRSWDKAIVYVKGIKSLKEGEVKTWYARNNTANNDIFLHKEIVSETNEKLEIDFNGSVLTVIGIRAKKDESNKTDEQCLSGIRLWKFKYKQFDRVLSSVCPDSLLDGEFDLATTQSYINWIGDIDNDGKPDLLVSPESGSEVMALYLSSQLEQGKKWKPAAIFDYFDPSYAGC